MTLFQRVFITGLFIGLFVNVNLQAQYSVKVVHFRPTGEFGAVMKRSIALELSYTDNFDDGHWRTRLGIMYIHNKPRMDTFPVFATVSGGSAGFQVLPGYQVFNRFDMIHITGGVDYRINTIGKLSPYIGTDILIGGTIMNEHTYYETYLDDYVSGSDFIGGFRFRAGAEYFIADRICLFGEVNRGVYLVTDRGFFSHYDLGLGVRYQLK